MLTTGIDLRMTLLPAKMKQAGYATAMTGKWYRPDMDVLTIDKKKIDTKITCMYLSIYLSI